MNEIRIKIKIAEREYPMRIDAAEEEKVRNASKLINDSLKDYSAKLGINDSQDLLAMVAFNSLVAKEQADQKVLQNQNDVWKRLQELDALISSAL